MATTATVNVQVNTQQAIDELDKAKDNVVKLRKALNDAISQGKSPLSIQQLSRALRTAQADVKKMQSELVNVDQQMRRLSTSNIDELEGVIKTINRRLRDGSVQQGSQEWQKLCGQLGQAKRRLDEVNRSITSQITNIDNGIGKLDKLNLKQLESLVGSITNKLSDGSIQRGSKQWDPMVEKLRLARKELDKVKQQLSGGAVDIKGGMAHLDTLNLKELDDLVGAINAKFKDGSVQRGSLQWKQLAEQLRQAEAELKAARDGIKNGVVNINQAMGQLQTLNVSQLDGLIKAINKKLNDGSVQRGSKQWDTLSEQLRRAKTELAGVKEQLEHAVVDISAQMGKLKTLGFADMEQLVGAINRKLRDGSVQRGSEEWKKLAEQLRQARRELSEVNSELTNGDSWMGRYAEHLNKFQYVWVQVAGAITGTVMAYTEWEKYFKKKDTAKANVQALTGMSKADVQWLADQAELLSSTSIGGLRIADDAADILQNMRLVGAAKPELLKNKEALEKTTIEAARLATASMEDLDVCVDALTKSLNIYSQGADQAAKFTNVLAAGSRFGASAVGDTAKVVIRAGVAAAGAKIPIEQLVGCTEMLAEKGLMGEKAGTALKTFFLKLQTGARNCNPAVVGLDKALENLAKQHLTASDMLKMFEQRAFNAAKILIDNRDKMKYYTEAVTGTSVAYEQACINSDSFETRLAQLKNSLNVVKEQLAVELKPVIGQVLIMMRTWITYLLPLIKWIKQHSTAIKLLVGAVAVYLGKLLVLKALHSSVVVGVVSFCSSLFKLKTYIGLATVVMGKWRGALMAVKSTLLACSVGFKGFVGHIKKATAAIKAFVLASNMRTAGIVGAVMAIGTAFVFLKDKITGAVRETEEFQALMKKLEEMRESAEEAGRQRMDTNQKNLDILKNVDHKYTFDERKRAEEALREFFPDLKVEWQGTTADVVNETELRKKMYNDSDEIELQNLDKEIDLLNGMISRGASSIAKAQIQLEHVWEAFNKGIKANTKLEQEIVKWWDEQAVEKNAALRERIAGELQSKANVTGILVTEADIDAVFATSPERMLLSTEQYYDPEQGNVAINKVWYRAQENRRFENKVAHPDVADDNMLISAGLDSYFVKNRDKVVNAENKAKQLSENDDRDMTVVYVELNKALARRDELLSQRKEGDGGSNQFDKVPGKSKEERENEANDLKRQYQTKVQNIEHKYRVGKDRSGKPYNGFDRVKEYGSVDKWYIGALRRVWKGFPDEQSDITTEADKLSDAQSARWRELKLSVSNIDDVKFGQYDDARAAAFKKAADRKKGKGAASTGGSIAFGNLYDSDGVGNYELGRKGAENTSGKGGSKYSGVGSKKSKSSPRHIRYKEDYSAIDSSENDPAGIRCIVSGGVDDFVRNYKSGRWFLGSENDTLLAPSFAEELEQWWIHRKEDNADDYAPSWVNMYMENEDPDYLERAKSIGNRVRDNPYWVEYLYPRSEAEIKKECEDSIEVDKREWEWYEELKRRFGESVVRDAQVGLGIKNFWPQNFDEYQYWKHVYFGVTNQDTRFSDAVKQSEVDAFKAFMPKTRMEFYEKYPGIDAFPRKEPGPMQKLWNAVQGKVTLNNYGELPGSYDENVYVINGVDYRRFYEEPRLDGFFNRSYPDRKVYDPSRGVSDGVVYTAADFKFTDEQLKATTKWTPPAPSSDFQKSASDNGLSGHKENPGYKKSLEELGLQIAYVELDKSVKPYSELSDEKKHYSLKVKSDGDGKWSEEYRRSLGPEGHKILDSSKMWGDDVQAQREAQSRIEAFNKGDKSVYDVYLVQWSDKNGVLVSDEKALQLEQLFQYRKAEDAVKYIPKWLLDVGGRDLYKHGGTKVGPNGELIYPKSAKVVDKKSSESSGLESWTAEENLKLKPLAFDYDSLEKQFNQLELVKKYAPEMFVGDVKRAYEAILPLIKTHQKRDWAISNNKRLELDVKKSADSKKAAAAAVPPDAGGLKGNGEYARAVKEYHDAKRALDAAVSFRKDFMQREYNKWYYDPDRDKSVTYSMTEGRSDSFPWSPAIAGFDAEIEKAQKVVDQKAQAVNAYGGGSSKAAFDGFAASGDGLHEVFSYFGLDNMDSVLSYVKDIAETTSDWFVDRDENPTIENFFNYTKNKDGRIGNFDEDGDQVGGMNYEFAALDDPIGFIEYIRDYLERGKAELSGRVQEAKVVQAAINGGDTTGVNELKRYDFRKLDRSDELFVGDEEAENLTFAFDGQSKRALLEGEKQLPVLTAQIAKCNEWLKGNVAQGVAKKYVGVSSDGVAAAADEAAGEGKKYGFVKVPKELPRSEYEKASHAVVSGLPVIQVAVEVAKNKIKIGLDEHDMYGKPKDSKEYVDLERSIVDSKKAIDELKSSYKTLYNFGMSRVVENPAGLDYTQTSTDDKLNNLRRDILEYQHTRDLTLQNANTENLQKIATMNDEFIDMCVAYFKQINDKYEEQFGGVFAGMADKVKSVDLSKYVGKSTKSVKAEYNYVDELTRQLFDRIDDYYSGKRLSNEQKQEKQDKEAAIGNQSKVLKQRITALNFDDLLSENAKTMRQEHQYLDQLRQDDLLSEEVYLEKKKEMQWRHFNTVLERAKQIYESIDSVVQASQEYSAACIEEETARIEKSYEKRIQACGNSSRRAALLERQKEKDIAKIKNEHNRRAVAIQIAQAIAQTAFNAVEAYGSMAKIPVVGPVLAAIAMASAIAAGMLQVATIKKQAAAQAAGYQSGGFTPKGKPDEVQGAVHSGEFVANRYAVRNPELLPALQLIDAAQRNNTVGRLTAEDVTRSLRTRVSPDVVEAVSVGGERLQSVQSDNGAALVATSKALSRSGQVLDKLEQRLEEGITAVSVIDGDNGVHRQLRKYEKLVANGRR